MKTISVSAYNRPQWLESTLRQLARLPGASEWTALVSIDGSEKSDEVRRVADGTLEDANIPHRIVTHASHIGHNANYRSIVDELLAIGSDFNVGIDDDCDLSPDFLELVEFYRCNTRIWANAFIAQAFQAHEEPIFEDDERLIYIRPNHFSAQGWCITADRLDMVRRWLSNEKRMERRLFDGTMLDCMLEHGFATAVPKIPRIKPLGIGGTNMDQGHWDRLYRNVPFWNGFVPRDRFQFNL